MKQKAKFVKAGPTTLSIVYPLAFQRLCKELDVEPEITIKCLIKELTFYSVIFPGKTKAQAFAVDSWHVDPGFLYVAPPQLLGNKSKSLMCF